MTSEHERTHLKHNYPLPQSHARENYPYQTQ